MWVVFALISAFTLATSDALTKKALKNSNEYLVAWFRFFFSLPLLLIIWLFVPVPELDAEFYKAFAILVPLETVTIVLYIKALRLSPLSLTLPFLALTPVFLIFISYLIVGEKVSFRGGAGIFLIAVGSYTLNIREIKKGIFEPFRSIAREKGSIMMIGVAVIYSLTASFGKVAIEHSSPLFFAVTYFTALTVFFAPIAFWMGRNELGVFFRDKQFKKLVLPGIFLAVMAATHMLAMSLTKVAYMISVKRLSLIIGIMYGYFLFREENIKERFLGAVLMLIGFMLVVTAL
ncbi:MAG: DMT family transporter [Thermodesulfovibrionales bacterium]|nr:DMT family transporter [Nitrospinota bacterium]MCG2710081.1 DMT family transporter [Thermodesulfovibrionales bacterium]